MSMLPLLQPVLQPAGIDLFCVGKKFLVFNLVSRNLTIKYRRSFLGVFWTLLSPLGTALVFYFVFKVILNIQIPHYLAFILSGILPWAFFSGSITENMESLVDNFGLISKIPIQIQIFPLVGTITNLVTLGFATPIIIGAAIFSDVHLGPSLIMLFMIFGFLFLMAYSFSLVLAVAFVYFRDLRHLMSIVMQIWFYASPVLYDESMIPDKYRWILYCNPVGTVFLALHRILVQGAWPLPESILIMFGWATTSVLLAFLVRKHLCHELVEQL